MIFKSSYKVFGREFIGALKIETADRLAIFADDGERLYFKGTGFLRQKSTSCLPTAAASTNPTVSYASK